MFVVQIERRDVDLVPVAFRHERHDALLVGGPERSRFIFLNPQNPAGGTIEQPLQRRSGVESFSLFVEEQPSARRACEHDRVVDHANVEPASVFPWKIFEYLRTDASVQQ